MKRIRFARQDRPSLPAEGSNGKLNIAHHAGFWLRDSYGNPTHKFKHICWDGCMFPNEVMHKQQTWNDIPRRDDRRPRSAWVELIAHAMIAPLSPLGRGAGVRG
ncbi:MAG: hypothetical protein U0744_11930 [Gemmataceae bacterium]